MRPGFLFDVGIFQRYLNEFEELARYLKQRNIRLIVIKPPVPDRFYRMLPNEKQFDEALQSVLQRNSVAFYDDSLVSNDAKFFFNSDHLNRDGVLNYFETHLKKILTP